MKPALATTVPDHYLVGNASSAFSISGLRVPILAVLATIGLGLLVVIPGGAVTLWMMQRMGINSSATVPPLLGAVNHTAMLITALLLIAWIGKGRFSDYGLRWPEGKSYVLASIAWGTFFGILMTAIDYLPQIVRHLPPPGDLSLAPANIAAYLAAYGLYVGPSEEIAFRGLLQTFLMQRTSGTVRVGRFQMHVAGIILALLFAVAHITTFWQINFWLALGQQMYAFALGVLYAYWREKSGSLLAPVLGHNFSDGVEYALMFFLTWVWG